MSTLIAQTAVVDPRAEIGKNVRIGHFCVIGAGVTIGDETQIEDHVVISGITSIGEDNHIFPGCVIGAHPQDTGYRNAPTRVEIGHGNTLREHCTVNRGTEKEDGVTRIGDNNFFMIGTHVAHDCNLGDRIVIANNTMLGGHVHIANDVTIAGGVGVHHFASIGQLCFIGGMSRVLHDVPPYMIVDGHPSRPRTVNTIGLKRHDYPSEDIQSLTAAYKLLYRSRVGIEVARTELMSAGPIRPVLKHLFDFLDHTSGGRHGRGRDRRRIAA
jgi:UDP-N-acetylglucosamine acyltransferase